MPKWLEKYRNMPDNRKKYIAFLWTFAFTGIIFVVWVSVLMPSFIRNLKAENNKEISPKDNLKATAIFSIKDIKDKIVESKQLIEQLKLSSDIIYKASIEDK